MRCSSPKALSLFAVAIMPACSSFAVRIGHPTEEGEEGSTLTLPREPSELSALSMPLGTTTPKPSTPAPQSPESTASQASWVPKLPHSEVEQLAYLRREFRAYMVEMQGRLAAHDEKFQGHTPPIIEALDLVDPILTKMKELQASGDSANYRAYDQQVLEVLGFAYACKEFDGSVRALQRALLQTPDPTAEQDGALKLFEAIRTRAVGGEVTLATGKKLMRAASACNAISQRHLYSPKLSELVEIIRGEWRIR